MAIDAGGLVEALVAIHRPNHCWSTGARADVCTSCSETWPCMTLQLVCEATGSPVPPQQMTGCDGMIQVDSGGWTQCLLDRGHDGLCRNQEGREQPTFCDPYDAYIKGWSERPEGWATRSPDWSPEPDVPE